jgi:protein involved in polysaccharide export with SLBB domain
VRLIHRNIVVFVCAGLATATVYAQIQQPRQATSETATGAASFTPKVPNVPTFGVELGDEQDGESDRAGTMGRQGSLGTGRKTSELSPKPSADEGVARSRAAKRRSTEFSRYASKVAGQPLYVFGGEFFAEMSQFRSGAGSAIGPAVPPDYLVNAGDELYIQIGGPFEAEIRQQVRRGGDITLPRVGSIRVAGVTAADLAGFLKTKLESQFKNIQVSASFVSLHGMRVYVTGFVESPGPHVVDSLSTLASAIAAAGGPSEGGSYRLAELWRKGQRITSFDLYELLVRGDKSKDVGLTADDVIRVAPASSFQVALTGSVNRPGVYELLPSEGLNDALQFAGGFTPVADRSRLATVQIDSNGQRQVREIAYQAGGTSPLSDGAVLHVFSSASLDPGINSTLKIVKVEGEVKRPGSYVSPASSKIADAIVAAGGLTDDAFMRGLTLTRESLAREQAKRLQESLDELERTVFEASTSAPSTGSESAAAAGAASNAVRSYIDRLRLVKPTGRLVMARLADGSLEADPVLENGDRIQVPSKPNNISVFGAVYGEGSYLADKPTRVEDFLRVLGGTRPGADVNSIFVLKADGSIRSDSRGWLSRVPAIEVEPGDTIVVPTDATKGRNWAIARDVGTLLYQFGLGAAAIKTLK